MFTWTLVQWKQDGTMLSSCRAEKDLSTQGRATRRRDATGEDHRPLAARARHGEGRPHGFANGTPPEKKAHPAKGTHRGGAEEAEVSHGNEPFGEDVEEPAANEFLRIDRLALPLAVVAILVPQEEAAVLIGARQTAFVEGGPGDVGCQVAQGGAASSSGLAMADPLLLPYTGIDPAM